jgi:hypothetical protein
VVFSIFVLLKFPEPDWWDDADWKRVRIWPGREKAKGQGNRGPVNPRVSAGYSAIKTCWRNLLDHAGTGDSALRLPKIASLARRSSAQHSMEALSATAGQKGQVAIRTKRDAWCFETCVTLQLLVIAVPVYQSHGAHSSYDTRSSHSPL